MSKRIYKGRRTEEGGTVAECIVTVEIEGHLKPRPLKPRFDLRNHSPTGFSWGYAGSGPAQLALAILADHFEAFPDEAAEANARFPYGDDEKDPADAAALRLYQDFKVRVGWWRRSRCVEARQRRGSLLRRIDLGSEET